MPRVEPQGDDAAVSVVELTKSYRMGHLRPHYRPALKSLSLRVPRGEIFGFLGPNGAGKTTTLKILMGLMFPDSGSATILGAPLASNTWRRRVGYLPEQPYFYDYLTGAEYLEYAGALFGLPKAERRDRGRALLEKLGLGSSMNVSVRRYSKGMLQRLGLAQALINDPELVFLDEPMSGLDPLGRRLVRDVIVDLKAQKKTVFFSTHILPDAEALCDRVGLLEGGRLVNSGTLGEILNLNVSHVEVLVSGITADRLPREGIRQTLPVGERWRLEVGEESVFPVLAAVAQAGGRIVSLQQVRQTLEDYFFKEVAGSKTDRWTPQD